MSLEYDVIPVIIENPKNKKNSEDNMSLYKKQKIERHTTINGKGRIAQINRK